MSGADTIVPADAGAIIRSHKTSFGPYLRGLRQQRGLSLRDAAGQLGLTFTKLQKMETGGRFRMAGLDFLLAIADLYGRPRAEVLHEAGIQVVQPDGLKAALNIDRAFAALVLHPDLRPLRMDQAWAESFSTLQKAQWIEFARKLAAVPEPASLVERVAGGSAVVEASQAPDQATQALRDVLLWATGQEARLHGHLTDETGPDQEPKEWPTTRSLRVVVVLPRALRVFLELRGYDADGVMRTWYDRGWLHAEGEHLSRQGAVVERREGYLVIRRAARTRLEGEDGT